MSCSVLAVPSPLVLSPLMGNLTSRVAAPPLCGSEAIDFAVLTRGPLPPMHRPGGVGNPFARADRARDRESGTVRHGRHAVFIDMGIHERTMRDDAKKDTDSKQQAQRQRWSWYAKLSNGGRRLRTACTGRMA